MVQNLIGMVRECQQEDLHGDRAPFRFGRLDRLCDRYLFLYAPECRRALYAPPLKQILEHIRILPGPTVVIGVSGYGGASQTLR